MTFDRPKYLPNLLRFDNEQDWLTARRDYLTASDAPVLCGKVSNKNAMTVWAEKVAKEPPEPKREVFMRIGHATEQLNADLYEEATGRELFNLGDYTMVVCQEIPYLSATLDRRVCDVDLGWGVHELKWRGSWNQKTLEEYWCQLQHQMLCCGYKWGSISILDASGHWDWFGFDRDERFLSAYKALCKDFWASVVCGYPPGPLDGSKATQEALAAAFPTDDGSEVVLPWEARLWDEEYQIYSESISEYENVVKDLKTKRKTIEQKFRVAMGDAATGIMAGCRWTLNTTEKKAFLTPACSYRVLRRKEAKDERDTDE